MSYARFGPDSDVYLYPTCGYESFVCCGCTLANEGFVSREFRSRRAMLAHMHEHQDKGDAVPQYAFDRVLRELDDEAEESQDSP